MALKIERYLADRSNILSTDRAPKNDVTVPGSIGFTNLAHSKMILDMHVDVNDIDELGNALPVVFPTTFGRDNEKLTPGALIRNTLVEMPDHGIKTGMQFQNIVNENLGWYQRSRAEEDERSSFDGCTTRNYGVGYADRLPSCPFIDYRGSRPQDAIANGVAVTQAAAKLRPEIPVHWGHIDKFHRMEQFPNMVAGDIKYHTEFENDIQVIHPAVMPTMVATCANRAAAASLIGNAGAPVTTVLTKSQFVRPPKVGDFVRLWAFETVANRNVSGVDYISAINKNANGTLTITLATGIGTTGATNPCENIHLFYGEKIDYGSQNVNAVDNGSGTIVIGFNDATALILQNFYDTANSLADCNQCPFYVGCPVRVVGFNNNANTAHAVSTTVSSLKRNGRDLRILLTNPLVVGGAANNTVNSIYIVHRDHSISAAGTRPFTVTWTVDEQYAEMVKLVYPRNMMDQLREQVMDLSLGFVDYELEAVTVPENTKVDQDYRVPAMTMGVSLFTPQTRTLLSGFDNCQSYRWYLNGKQVTSSDIAVGNQRTTSRGLHNVMLKKFFGNMGIPLKKYDCQATDDSRLDDKNTHAFYPLVTPMVPETALANIQLSSTENMALKTFYFVSHVSKSLVFQNGRVMIE